MHIRVALMFVVYSVHGEVLKASYTCGVRDRCQRGQEHGQQSLEGEKPTRFASVTLCQQTLLKLEQALPGLRREGKTQVSVLRPKEAFGEGSEEESRHLEFGPSYNQLPTSWWT